MLTPFSAPYTVEYLLVGGGGGGGFGGGSGGQVKSGSVVVFAGSGGAVTVGPKGNGSGGTTYGTDGGSSIILGLPGGTLTAVGGGFGGLYSDTLQNASNGAYGGGAGTKITGSPPPSGAVGVGTVAHQGGAGYNDGVVGPAGGGGGGANANGTSAFPDGTGVISGNGGDGSASSISGSSLTYGGGGRGDSGYINGTMGACTAAKGGGGPGVVGGGGAADGQIGIVILRYLGNQRAAGGTITSGTGSSVGYTLHTFTVSSTFTA